MAAVARDEPIPPPPERPPGGGGGGCGVPDPRGRCREPELRRERRLAPRKQKQTTASVFERDPVFLFFRCVAANKRLGGKMTSRPAWLTELFWCHRAAL